MVGPAESSTTAQTAVFTPEQQATISAVIQAAITQALATQAAQTAQTVTPAVTVATNSTKDLDLGKPFTFTGKAHDLEKFLQDCALHFTVKRSVYDTDERKAGFMLSHMAGDAARWKEQYMQSQENLELVDPTIGIDGFTAALRASFSEPYRKDNALQQLQHIKQGKNSIDSHNVQFKLLVERAGMTTPANNDVLTNMYSTSLNPNIRGRILTMDTVPTSLDDWYKRAAHFANAFDRLHQGQWTQGGFKGKPFQQRRQGYYQASGSHKDPNAMDVDAISFDERQKRLKDGACFICAEKGHFSGQCPKRKEYREQRAGSRNGQGQWKPQGRPQGQGKPQGRPQGQGKPQGRP